MKEWLFSNVTWLDLLVLAGVFFVSGWMYGIISYVIHRKQIADLKKAGFDKEHIRQILRKM